MLRAMPIALMRFDSHRHHNHGEQAEAYSAASLGWCTAERFMQQKCSRMSGANCPGSGSIQVVVIFIGCKSVHRQAHMVETPSHFKFHTVPFGNI
jgi:hypothetical protein